MSKLYRIAFGADMKSCPVIVWTVTVQGPVSRKARKLFGPGKLFYVSYVCIEDQSFNNFESDKMKLSVNEAKLTGLWARDCDTIQQVLI